MAKVSTSRAVPVKRGRARQARTGIHFQGGVLHKDEVA
jgi:hypothetical protein